MLILVLGFEVCNPWIVSTLASRARFPATVPDLANRPRQLVFLSPIDSQLNDFLNEIHQIARFEPSIVERIDENLDLHAKKKKRLRLADAQFLAGPCADLFKRLRLECTLPAFHDLQFPTFLAQQVALGERRNILGQNRTGNLTSVTMPDPATDAASRIRNVLSLSLLLQMEPMCYQSYFHP
jgi:hypothetical protein